MLTPALLALTWALPAAAQQLVAAHGIAPIAPRTVSGVDVAAATFDYGGQSGSWQSVTPAIDVALGGRLSLFTALPVARIDFDEGPTYAGPGDLTVSGKLRLFGSPQDALSLSAGLGVELPTGNANKGLGAGHVELTPFATGSASVLEAAGAQWLVYGVLAPRFSTGEGGHGGPHRHTGALGAHAHGAVLSPHASREVYGRLATALVWSDAYILVGAEGAAVPGSEGDGYLGVRTEAGYIIEGTARLHVGLDATVAGERRYGARARTGIAWLF